MQPGRLPFQLRITILVQGAPTLAGLHAQDGVLPHKLTEPLLISQLPGRASGPGGSRALLQLLLLDIPTSSGRALSSSAFEKRLLTRAFASDAASQETLACQEQLPRGLGQQG